MLFMVIETFRDQDPVPVYRHLRDHGRGLPDGLSYIDSWISADFRTCYQLMDCDDVRLLQQWSLHWRGSGVAFDFVPVVPSKDVRELVAPHLDAD